MIGLLLFDQHGRSRGILFVAMAYLCAALAEHMIHSPKWGNGHMTSVLWAIIPLWAFAAMTAWSAAHRYTTEPTT